MRKAIEVELTDGRKITVKEPSMVDLPLLLRAMPSLEIFGQLANLGDDNVIMPPLDMNPQTMLPIYELLSSMSGLPTEELVDMSLSDGMNFIVALGELIPKNFTLQKVS